MAHFYLYYRFRWFFRVFLFCNIIKKYNKMTQTQPSKLKKFLQIIDVFSYVPVPQAYPVSTNKSKIGSAIFIAILLGYLIYDFYNYITNNIPIVYALQADSINKGNITVPQFAFGMYFSDPNQSSSTQYIVNNASYFQYTLESTYIQIIDNKTVTKYKKIPTRSCYPIEWASKQYGNLTCPNISAQAIKQMNLSYPIANQDGVMIMSESNVSGVITDYYFRLRVNLCTGSNCASIQNLTYFLQNAVFLFLARQPVGYDYKAGQPLASDHVKVYRYLLNNKTTSLVALYVTPTRFLKFPNFITKFKTEQTQYSSFTRQTITNYTYRLSFMLRLRIYPEWTMDIVEIHPQTIIDRISQWSAFSSLVFMIAAVCFLGYNRRKFNRRNPDWQRFDQMLKEKLQVQMQPLGSSKNENTGPDQKNIDQPPQPLQQNTLTLSINQQTIQNQQNLNDDTLKQQNIMPSHINQTSQLRESFIHESNQFRGIDENQFIMEKGAI